MSERPNFFQLLELDPLVDNWPLIEQRIEDKRRAWSKDSIMGSPKARRAAREALEFLPAMRQALRDPANREREAQDAIRRSQLARSEVLRTIREAIAILKTTAKFVTPQQARLLAERYKGVLSQGEVIALLKEEGLAFEPIEAIKARAIDNGLQHLGFTSLYDFLGLAAHTSPDGLLHRADEIYSENQQLGRTDSRASSSNELAGLAHSIFQDVFSKACYDRYLSLEALSHLNPDLEIAGVNGVLKKETVEVLLDRARRRDAPDDEALTYIADYARAQGWQMEQPAKTAAAASRVCRYCAASLPVGASNCQECGNTLDGDGSASSAEAEFDGLYYSRKNGLVATARPYLEALLADTDNIKESLLRRAIRNVTSRGFGILALDDEGTQEVRILFEPNDIVPRSSTIRIETLEEGIRSMEFVCMETSSRSASQVPHGWRKLGKAVVSFERPLKKSVGVNVTFRLAPDGLLSIAGEVPTEFGTANARLEMSSIMTERDLEESKRRNFDKKIVPGSSIAARTGNAALDTGEHSPQERRDVLISYSHQDEKSLRELETMMAPLVRNGVVLWSDKKIKPGQLWKEEIKKALARAKVAVLLVSPSFLSSTFIVNSELPPLLSAAETDGVVITWVYLKYCYYENTEIVNFQAAHDIKQPLASLSRPRRDRALKAICREIYEVVSTRRVP